MAFWQPVGSSRASQTVTLRSREVSRETAKDLSSTRQLTLQGRTTRAPSASAASGGASVRVGASAARSSWPVQIQHHHSRETGHFPSPSTASFYRVSASEPLAFPSYAHAPSQLLPPFVANQAAAGSTHSLSSSSSPCHPKVRSKGQTISLNTTLSRSLTAFARLVLSTSIFWFACSCSWSNF